MTRLKEAEGERPANPLRSSSGFNPRQCSAVTIRAQARKHSCLSRERKKIKKKRENERKKDDYN